MYLKTYGELASHYNQIIIAIYKYIVIFKNYIYN